MSSGTNLPIVFVKNLSKTVPNVNNQALNPLVILNEINFSIQSSETVAIIGPSGSGKSTLLGILAGLDILTSGHVEIAGQNIFSFDEDKRAYLRAQKIGFVFQSFQLLSTFTALENVMLPLEILGNNDARAISKDVLIRVGLHDRLDHYPAQLSGGEQQRVAIARAFAPRPALLLADEPTGNLDSNTGQRIIELLFELNQEHGATLILVTHDNNLAARCDRAVHLENGSLVNSEKLNNLR